MELRITTLIEDEQDQEKQLLFEHGFSLYIEFEGKNILFDTGQTGAFVKNAVRLQKNLKDLNYVIVSHGHYDHGGGVKTALPYLAKGVKMFVGEGFFNSKYKKVKEGEYCFRGIDLKKQEIKDQYIDLQEIKEDVTYLNENILLFKNFRKNNSYETVNPKFVLKKKDQYEQDFFLEELCLGLITKRGLVVITGCSHSGIINIMETIEERVGIPVYGVVGGTHLIEADEKRINWTIEKFESMNIKKIALSHCTGEKAVEMVKERAGEMFIQNHTGNIIQF